MQEERFNTEGTETTEKKCPFVSEINLPPLDEIHDHWSFRLSPGLLFPHGRRGMFRHAQALRIRLRIQFTSAAR